VNVTDDRPEAICLMGPTAAGKTDLALALADALGAGIISVDSAQIYRGMDVGTAKPSPEVLARYPHALIDIRDPAESYSAADFRDDAIRSMRELIAAGRRPLLVGGTMLYFRVLEAGIADLPPADPAIRADIEAHAAAEGWPGVHRLLADVDPASAARIHPTDPQRLQRALEVYRLTGRPMSELHREQLPPAPLPCKLRWLAVAPSERAVLHQRIELRFRQMLEQGFLDEVRALYARGDLHPGLPSVRSAGYRQAWEHLEGRLPYEEMIDRAIMATRQLAKRQLTWLRSWKELEWLPVDQQGRAGLRPGDDLLEEALKRLATARI
jgi:tRNA dimethylallyltransferase